MPRHSASFLLGLLKRAYPLVPFRCPSGMNGHLEGEKPSGFLGTKTNHCSSPLNWDDPPSSQPWFTFWSFVSVLWFLAFARIHWKRQSLGNGREVGLLFAMFMHSLKKMFFFLCEAIGLSRRAFEGEIFGIFARRKKTAGVNWVNWHRVTWFC